MSLLDDLLRVRHHLERENLPAARLRMICGNLDTPLGAVPFIVQTPFPALAQPRAEVERAAFARFGGERPWPDAHQALREVLQTCVDAPVIWLERAFVRVAQHPGECVLTLGTQGTPGWTNQNCFEPSLFDSLKSMSGIGGLLVHFSDPFERSAAAPEPECADTVAWTAIYRPGVGEAALALAKRPRERLILLLAVYLHMGPREINQLNLAQVTQSFGRDGQARVSLKQRLVRKKVLAEALLQYRRRDRDTFWGTKEPMFCGGPETPSGRSRRMGANAIEALILRYVERALKTLPSVQKDPEPPVPPAQPGRPPLFWVTDIQYQRAHWP
ncbi:hypothetical protein [Thiocystis violacea]|uniref:hypothetical protein n=1 Tax=Thiocystis violacea TaxID=13725 RepID=UPI001904580F|nr:hypothetical protein [Thiocystis violacea]